MRASIYQHLVVGLIIFAVLSAGLFVAYGLPKTSNLDPSIVHAPLVQLTSPQSSTVQLNVPFCDQDESVNKQNHLPGTCWDAAAAMILDYWHNQGYLAYVPSQSEIYSDTMSYGGGNLDAALASLGFYTAEFDPKQALFVTYGNYYQQSNALNATQMIYTAQMVLSLGVPLEATVETQPYPQATVNTGGILCDSRGGNHAIAITGYNQTGFIFNSATNEQFNPAFVYDDSLNTYASVGRVVNGYELYCPYSEFIAAYNSSMWYFTAVFPINYQPIMQQQKIHLVNSESEPMAGMLVSSPFSSAQTDSNGNALLEVMALGTPISVGNDIQAHLKDEYSGQYAQTTNFEVGFCFRSNDGMYLLHPENASSTQPTENYIVVEYLT